MERVKERPILFSGEMVRALLDDRKTQTRRVTKPQPRDTPVPYSDVEDDPTLWRFDIEHPGSIIATDVRCPYGAPGDRLWVRETWFPAFKRTRTENGCVYKADYGHRKDLVEEYNPGWVPSIHMFRWASRILLEVTAVRVERVQEIPQDDAKAEGIGPAPHRAPSMGAGCDDAKWSTGTGDCYRCAFRILWNSINGKRGNGWDKNPWVWVVEFKRVTP